MLGTSFFNEMTGHGKKSVGTKVYDQVNVAMDFSENGVENDESASAYNAEDWTQEEMTETLAQEGDDDAIYIMDFESAASEVLQTDEELATAYSSYVEATRKLSEKFRSRGFWPVGKGKGKGSKGTFKSKAPWGRKTLQQRILERNCRLCGKKGHWKSKCPQRQQPANASAGSAPVTLSMGTNDVNETDDIMPMEFMSLPEVDEHGTKDYRPATECCFVESVCFDGSNQRDKLNL